MEKDKSQRKACISLMLELPPATVLQDKQLPSLWRSRLKVLGKHLFFREKFHPSGGLTRQHTNLPQRGKFAPVLGYDVAAGLAKQAFKENKTIRELVREKGLLSDKELDRLLNAERMTKPGKD